MRIEAAGYVGGSYDALLEALGERSMDHIPSPYLRASERQRRELLAGLLDVAGDPAASGAVEVASPSWRFLADVRELVLSLGYHCGIASLAQVGGTAHGQPTQYVAAFSTDDQVFRLERKALLHKEHAARGVQPAAVRFITAARWVASVPVRCIEVDNADHLYLASRSMIRPTTRRWGSTSRAPHRSSTTWRR
jgi:replicative DNA helicase